MNINPKIEKIFKDFEVDNIKIPISYLKNENKVDVYLTYYTVNELPEGFADDNAILESTYGTIDIFSKSDFKNILKEVKKILKNNNFTVTGISAEDYEESTGYYHVPVDFFIESEVD